MRKLYWNIPAFSETCNFDHIKSGYYSIKVCLGFLDILRLTTYGNNRSTLTRSCPSDLYLISCLCSDSAVTTL